MTTGIPRRLRFEILRRDGHTCRYCGAAAPKVRLQVDHVIPQALGGETRASNLVTACCDCNAGKASTSPDSQTVAEVDARAIAWNAAIAKAYQERAEEAKSIRFEQEAFELEWYARLPWSDLPADWRASIARFYGLGLTVVDMTGFMSQAAALPSGNRWRYFCGCCWNTIREVQARAAEIVEAGR